MRVCSFSSYLHFLRILLFKKKKREEKQHHGFCHIELDFKSDWSKDTVVINVLGRRLAAFLHR